MKQIQFKKTGIILIICTIPILCILCLTGKDKNYIVSDLLISNIEALAAGEGGGEACIGSGSVYCNGSYYKIRFSR